MALCLPLRLCAGCRAGYCLGLVFMGQRLRGDLSCWDVETVPCFPYMTVYRRRQAGRMRKTGCREPGWNSGAAWQLEP